MRCLQCGSTLSAFKKLTDADFCSAEHRDVFYSEQQRLILARLKHSADRQMRLRRPATAAEATRVSVNPAAVPVEEPVPAPIAAFLLPKPELQNSAWRSRCRRDSSPCDGDTCTSSAAAYRSARIVIDARPNQRDEEEEHRQSDGETAFPEIGKDLLVRQMADVDQHDHEEEQHHDAAA